MARRTYAKEVLKALKDNVRPYLVDSDRTAWTIVTLGRQKQGFDCILIGASLREIPRNFILPKKLMNVVHEHTLNA